MSGLSLPDVLGPSDNKIAEIQQRYDTFDEIELECQRMGFSAMEKPQHDYPVITPDTLSSITHSEYTKTFTEFNGWYSYAHNTLARMKALRLGKRQEMDEINRAIREDIARSNIKFSAERKTEKVESHPRHGELRFEIMKLDQQIMLMDSHVESLERSLKLISRQIELIKMDHENNRVNGNMPNRGRPGMGQLR